MSPDNLSGTFRKTQNQASVNNGYHSAKFSFRVFPKIEMTESKRLAVCVLRYLKGELSNPAVSEESKESLEVAIQCLESVYEVGPDDLSALAVRMTLPEMFKNCAGNERAYFKSEQSSAAGEAASKKEPNPEAEAAKLEGNELLKAEKYQEALEMYSKAIDLDPYNAVYFCNRAAAFSKLDKSSEAIEDCEAALKIDPTYSKAYGRMGIAYANMGDHEKAYKCYQKALQLDPTNESYKNNLRVARDQITAMGGVLPPDETSTATNAGAGARTIPGLGVLGGGASLSDFTQMLGNPALMNMATHIMQDPNMQNLMRNIVSGAINAGQQQSTGPTAQASSQGEGQGQGQGQGVGVSVETGVGFNFDTLLRA
ncbi:small glutamine-rich tetratricopeptide repeat-containing protein alpha-like [Tropilaelaps mercedesae]|uniref:Small glutamine-rich tetratricopeptide repeat-containing protein alpha-like n=1 Tax=Tropilaelaps mercedesae TaxID=418985 RepID=A0A1V9WZA2_9ACAR|nr:small glutamine-rich tetratricopeptide repeat-containing protein alpha-like [Tropilaelaps mercedesae]